MRISDWSSDVCSSDLATAIRSVAASSATVSLQTVLMTSVSPNRAASCSASEVFCVSVMAAPSGTRDGAGAANLFLQLQNAVDQRLGRGRTARHVDVHRHDAIATAHHRIGIVVIDRKSTRLNSSH